jgi:choline-glycine betaine transporter
MPPSFEAAIIAIFATLPFTAIYLVTFYIFLKALEREEREAWRRLGEPEFVTDDLHSQWQAVQFVLFREYENLASSNVRQAGKRARTMFIVVGCMMAVTTVTVVYAMLQMSRPPRG